MCNQPSRVEETEPNSFSLSCSHMEQCTECREYQIEKLFRCVNCCNTILNQTQHYCGESCGRREVTIKSTALCCVCKGHLQKECKACKKGATFKIAKKAFKKRLFLLVRSPALLSEQDNRPCSHYALCKHCNLNVARGHKGNSVCRSCRSCPSYKTNGTIVASDDARKSLVRSMDHQMTKHTGIFDYRAEVNTLSPFDSPPCKRRRLNEAPRVQESIYDISSAQILYSTPAQAPRQGPLVSLYLQALAVALAEKQNRSESLFSQCG